MEWQCDGISKQKDPLRMSIKSHRAWKLKMFKEAFEVGNNSTDLTSRVTSIGANAMDWSATGSLLNASGNAGAKAVFDLLKNTYGTP